MILQNAKISTPPPKKKKLIKKITHRYFQPYLSPKLSTEVSHFDEMGHISDKKITEYHLPLSCTKIITVKL